MDEHEENENILNPKCLHLRGLFSNQVKTILKTMRMSRSEVLNLNIIYEDIRQTLNELWEGCVVKPFGSVVTGLALKSSDVDCFIEVRGDEDSVQCVQRAFHFLSNTLTPFQAIYTKTKTKIPCMRIFHRAMKIYCDISFSGPIAVETGELFANLLDNNKLLALAVLIKYWSKVHKIAGSKLLPNSALTFLLVVFLQNENILPSIASLQENVPPVTLDGWNVAFQRMNYEPYTSKSLYQLLGEFFVYYSNFNFADLVVSPYLGGFVDRRRLLNINNVPPEFGEYKLRAAAGERGTVAVAKAVCVQCPFDHGRNIAVAVRPPLAQRIVQCIRAAAESYRNYPKHFFLKSILNVHEPNSPIPAQIFGRKDANRGRLQGVRKIRRGGYVAYK